MGKVGRGSVGYLGPNESGTRIMDDFIERIRHPALTDLQLDWGGAAVTEVFPQRVPDVFVGRPVVLTGRFKDAKLARVHLNGEVGGKQVEWNVAANNANQPRG